MGALIDTSVWVDCLHPRTPRRARVVARREVARADAATCEPVMFELLRACPRKQRALLEAHLATLPVLPTPASLWRDASELGRRCHEKGWNISSIDLLIAAVGLHHDVELVSFDNQYAFIAKISPLKLNLLARA